MKSYDCPECGAELPQHATGCPERDTDPAALRPAPWVPFA